MAHIDVGDATATEIAVNLRALGQKISIDSLIVSAEVLLDPDLAVPRLRCNEATAVKRYHFVVDVDVADRVNLMPSKHDDLMQELVILASGLVISDRPAFAHLAVNELKRRDRVFGVD